MSLGFLALPRELRDMIYATLLAHERPRPTHGEAEHVFTYLRFFEPASARRGEYGCSYSLDPVPHTCANFMACNRQVYEEMCAAIQRARKRGSLTVRLDCIAEDESMHYFTWLGIPVVRTNPKLARCEPTRSRLVPGWADRLLERCRTCPPLWMRAAGSSYCGYLGCHLGGGEETVVHQLWVDVRILGDRAGKWTRNTGPSDRTSWALCAAVKRILEKGPDFARKGNSVNTVTVEELVLNVVSPPNVPKERYLPEDFPLDGVRNGLVHPKTVAKELVDVWNRIWAANEIKGVVYQVLLERIMKVRVCVDGETYRVRELRLELERGQAERRRIAARIGW